MFDTVSENFDTQSIAGDEDLYLFLKQLKSSSLVSVIFPIQIILSSGVEIEVFDFQSLENIIEMNTDVCDEDDDNNFDDGNCDTCNANQFNMLWLTCNTWEAHKFKLDKIDIQNLYDKYTLSFTDEGMVQAQSDTETIFGTWLANGSENDTTFEINIPGLDDFNRVWNLKEIKDKSDKIDIKLYDEKDELQLRSTCEN